MAAEKVRGNVHTIAPAPRSRETEENQRNVQLEPNLSNFVSPSSKHGKSQKLNPKRVGAAWAEKRKIELEKEKIVVLTGFPTLAIRL